MSNEKIIYLDNNGTTHLCKEAKSAMKEWIDVDFGNPSSNNKLSMKSKKLINDTKEYILNHCGITDNSYEVIFTSGGSESNSFIFRSILNSYYQNNRRVLPHFIISAIEHPSIIECCKILKNNNKIECDFIIPNNEGIIEPIDVKNRIKKNTFLISIMYSNNEIGSINNIKEISKIAHLYRIPFHTDAVQYFGKYKVNLIENNIDAISISFHKFYCPSGIGLLLISKSLINGYKLNGIINGMQQNGLRGGTENIICIAGAISGMKCNFNNRKEKNDKLLKKRNLILTKLNELIPIIYFSDYKKINIKEDIMLIIFGPKEEDFDKYMPNTILLSILSEKYNFCNTKLKDDLNKQNIILSIGSACSTEKKEASHVLTSLNASNHIKRGTIRISLGDNNTINEINKFILILIKCINNQIPIIDFIKNAHNDNKKINSLIKKIINS